MLLAVASLAVFVAAHLVYSVAGFFPAMGWGMLGLVLLGGAVDELRK